jgi:hypothetical protein
MAELEKLGQKYRVALRYEFVSATYVWLVLYVVQLLSTNTLNSCYRIAKDPRFQRLACTHKGTYADDCIVDRITQVEFCLHELCFCAIELKVQVMFSTFRWWSIAHFSGLSETCQFPV